MMRTTVPLAAPALKACSTCSPLALACSAQLLRSWQFQTGCDITSRMENTARSLSFSLTLFLLAAVFTASSSPCLAQDTASRMEQLVQSYVGGKHFMGSVLVAQGNHTLLNKGYGSANLEWDIPNSPSTKFRIGSMTKQFTAAAILGWQRGLQGSDSPPGWPRHKGIEEVNPPDS
jgi:CubicO group peptidase (beta-lactamase class C family)